MAAQLAGPGGEGKFQLRQNAEINVTPFVDVMLVLLIIFMVSAPLATVSIKVDLPPATPPKDAHPKKPTYISLQKGGLVYVVSTRTSLETLAADLARQLNVPNPKLETVLIRADRGVKWMYMKTVMKAVSQAGVENVTFSVVNKDQEGQ